MPKKHQKEPPSEPASRPVDGPEANWAATGISVGSSLVTLAQAHLRPETFQALAGPNGTPLLRDLVLKAKERFEGTPARPEPPSAVLPKDHFWVYVDETSMPSYPQLRRELSGKFVVDHVHADGLPWRKHPSCLLDERIGWRAMRLLRASKKNASRITGFMNWDGEFVRKPRERYRLATREELRAFLLTHPDAAKARHGDTIYAEGSFYDLQHWVSGDRHNDPRREWSRRVAVLTSDSDRSSQVLDAETSAFDEYMGVTLGSLHLLVRLDG